MVVHTKLRNANDAFLENLALGEPPAGEGEARLHLCPDALVGPRVDIVMGIALDIDALHLRRARAEQRKTAIVIGIDQLVP